MANPFDHPSGTPTGPITRFAEGLGLGSKSFSGRAHFVPIDGTDGEPSPRGAVGDTCEDGRRPPLPRAAPVTGDHFTSPT
jgi:hypothetical protein